MADEQFDYRAGKDGTVLLYWHGRHVTTLVGPVAARFLERIAGCDGNESQREMARVTGNFRRGNERLAKRRSRR